VHRLALPFLLAAVLVSSAAAETIRGTVGADVLRGGPGADRISGRAGNDRIDVAYGGSDRVACGAGNDLVVADRADRVGGDCETVVRRLSSDPFSGSRSQHATAVEPDDAASGSNVVAVYQVGRIASGGAAGIGFSVSRDAGRSWRSGILPGTGTASDPAVAWDAAHRVWLASTLGVAVMNSVMVSRSTDGLHWQAPTVLAMGRILDKEWIGCDNGAQSPFLGRCYVVYTDDELHRMVVQTSDDGGHVWTPPVRISADLLGAQPAIRPDGSLVVLAVDLPQDGRGVQLAFRSSDGGATFAGVSVASFVWHQPRTLRAVPLPTTAVGADGTVYAAWEECVSGTRCSANQVVLSQSTDGTSWSAPVAVTHGGADHFATGLGADPAQAGRLALVYAVVEAGSCASGSCRLGAGFTSSLDGGTTWRQPRRLDATPFPEEWTARAGGHMVGDYYSVAFADGRAVPVFALAEPPVGGRLREAIFATSLPVG
jgi:RTX calcium-binding nonapeptide repeat (4 copies)